MKRFLLKTVLVLGIFVSINFAYSAAGLFRLHRDYLNPKNGSFKIVRDNNAKAHSLIIGCSNLQHNIDFDRVKNSFAGGIDFLYFVGAENSTFLQFLSDHNYFNGYANVILYVPYHILKKSICFNEVGYHFQGGACFNYAKTLIRRTPSLFFYDWNDYYNSINEYRPISLIANQPDASSAYEIISDPYIDSLISQQTEFRRCSRAFIHDKHVIAIPHYNASDLQFLRSNFKKSQKIYLVFTPIPNIAENQIQVSTHSNNITQTFDGLTLINKPFVADSSLFFNQWYHLNYCGRQIETISFIENLRHFLE